MHKDVVTSCAKGTGDFSHGAAEGPHTAANGPCLSGVRAGTVAASCCLVTRVLGPANALFAKAEEAEWQGRGPGAGCSSWSPQWLVQDQAQSTLPGDGG